MPQKPKRKPRLSEAERHERFKEMAREVQASESPEDFERAFRAVSGAPKPIERP
jgi:hypothetical protein